MGSATYSTAVLVAWWRWRLPGSLRPDKVLAPPSGASGFNPWLTVVSAKTLSQQVTMPGAAVRQIRPRAKSCLTASVEIASV